MNIKHIISLFTFLLLIFSCSEKDNCNDLLFIVKQFGCEYTKYSTFLYIDLRNDYTIIRSQESFDSLVSGKCHPEINFSQYDLVIGRQSSPNLNYTIEYDLRRVCPDNKLTLTINIIQSDATQPDNVTYHALIPKLGDGETLYVRINTNW